MEEALEIGDGSLTVLPDGRKKTAIFSQEFTAQTVTALLTLWIRECSALTASGEPVVSATERVFF